MDSIGFYLILILTSVMSGFIAFFVLKRRSVHNMHKSISDSKKKAKALVENATIEAEKITTQKIAKAKETFIQLKKEYEISFRKQNKQLSEREKSCYKRSEKLKSQRKALLKESASQAQKSKVVEEKILQVETLEAEYLSNLSSLSSITVTHAKEELKKLLMDKASSEIQSQIQKKLAEAELKADLEAKKILLTSIQRLAVEQISENTSSTVSIESDEIKGRIIGKEGRNIRSFESITGVEVTVDDTPEVVLLSCFDPVRREIAKLSLQKLIKDGRIHPTRIEEIVAKTSKEIEEKILETGKKTVLELGVYGLHAELIHKVGRMKYRYSYGQNLLNHSKEVANMAAVMAAELKLDPKIAKRAGLLHDIGKVSQEEPEKPHALLGMEWAEKYGESPEVCNAIGAHHDEIEKKFAISFIVQTCDSISGARPGARKQNVEAYFEKLKGLEEVATKREGVKKSFAIQAGRELRVMVESEKISDEKAKILSFEISREIESRFKYPGQIKVVVIRETRSISTAK